MRSELIPWEGGEHEFALPLSALEALQDRMDGDGIGLIYQRLASGTHKAGDVTNTVVLALEGGGMKKSKAAHKVAKVYEDSGLNCMVLIAQVVIAAALNGWPDEEEEEPGEAGVQTQNSSQ